MKTKSIFTLLAAVLAGTISFAQKAQNSNPYAIFGGSPYVIGAESGQEQAKTFVIENLGEGSEVAWLEHNPLTGLVKFFDAASNLIAERQVTPGERAWPTMDRYAEKYYSISPYAYCANNPVRYVDLHGDSIDLAMMQRIDQALGTNYTQTMLGDLSAQTGLSYSISSTGVLTYAKNGDGSAIIAVDANGNQLGSATARGIMVGAISHSDMVTVGAGRITGVPTGSNAIGFSLDQMNSLINGAVGVDNRTLGWGMTLMHELQHTQVGGGLSDYPNGVGNPGPVVSNMNQVRAELNAQGGNYGQRQTYEATALLGNNTYIPFNSMSNASLQNQMSPYPSIPGGIMNHQYINFKTRSR